jgi:hypothetical protein
MSEWMPFEQHNTTEWRHIEEVFTHALEGIFDAIYLCPKVGASCIVPDDNRTGTDQINGTDDIERTRPVITLKKHLYMH